MSLDQPDLPTPEFRAHLEWEIVRAMRREARLGATSLQSPRSRYRIAAIMAACLLLGAAGNFATAQVRSAARRDSLVASVQAELELAQLRETMAQAKLDDATKKQRLGVYSQRELDMARAEFDAVHARTARLRLNVDEIRVGAQPPRDELTAPLVEGRDFVRERIQLDLAATQDQLSVAERAVAEVERQRRAGVATALERAEAAVALSKAQADFQVTAERMALRREALEKSVSAEVLSRKLAVAQARADITVAQQRLETARLREAEVTRQRAAGAATELELMRVRIEVKELELALAQMAVDLRRVGVGRDSLP